MKLNKSDLKNLIKECILELLVDGAASSGLQVEGLRSRQQQTPAQRQQPPANAHVAGGPKIKPEVVSDVVRSVAGKDNVLATVLADTLKTTFVEQVSSERMSPGVAAAIDSPSIDSFPDGDSHWSLLAFSGEKKH